MTFFLSKSSHSVVLTFEATRQSMYNVLYARVPMDTQFLDTVARVQAWARRMSHWTAVEGLEEHPGAPHSVIHMVRLSCFV
jgi:hypothetical protein